MSFSRSFAPLRVMLAILFTLFLITLGYSQSGASEDLEYEEEEEGDMLYTAGLYLSFEDFITNNPAPPALIATTLNRHSRDFYLQLFRERQIVIKTPDSTYVVAPKDVWGYSDGHSIHMNRAVFPATFDEYWHWTMKDVTEHPFARVTEVGTISLIYYVKTKAIRPGLRPVAFVATPVGGNLNRRTKDAEFLLDTRDGKIYKSSLEVLQTLIQNDPAIAKECKQSKEDRDIKLYMFLRKYNSTHPLTPHVRASSGDLNTPENEE